MDQGFIDILKQLAKEQGSAALTEAKKCKALLADYTRNEYKKESSWLVQAVEAGIAKAIDGADDLASCKKAKIRDLEEEKGLSSAVAADIVDALALVLRGDAGKTESPSAAPTAPSSTPVKGTLTLEKGVYEGDIANGKPNGKGKCIYKNGNTYEGDWVDGKRQGKGKSTSPMCVYEGDFFDDKMCGKGKSIYFDNAIYEGDYAESSRHGKGKMTNADGTVEEGNWKGGVFMGNEE
jgi:hypothetical protein